MTNTLNPAERTLLIAIVSASFSGRIRGEAEGARERLGMLLEATIQVRLRSFLLIFIFAFPAKMGDSSDLTDSGTLFSADTL